jgi:hypothetical protein
VRSFELVLRAEAGAGAGGVKGKSLFEVPVEALVLLDPPSRLILEREDSPSEEAELPESVCVILADVGIAVVEVVGSGAEASDRVCPTARFILPPVATVTAFVPLNTHIARECSLPFFDEAGPGIRAFVTSSDAGEAST